MRAVEEVKEFALKPQFGAVGKGDPFNEAEISLPEVRAADQVTRRGARAWARDESERRGIDPVANALAARGYEGDSRGSIGAQACWRAVWPGPRPA